MPYVRAITSFVGLQAMKSSAPCHGIPGRYPGRRSEGSPTPDTSAFFGVRSPIATYAYRVARRGSRTGARSTPSLALGHGHVRGAHHRAAARILIQVLEHEAAVRPLARLGDDAGQDVAFSGVVSCRNPSSAWTIAQDPGYPRVRELAVELEARIVRVLSLRHQPGCGCARGHIS